MTGRFRYRRLKQKQKATTSKVRPTIPPTIPPIIAFVALECGFEVKEVDIGTAVTPVMVVRTGTLVVKGILEDPDVKVSTSALNDVEMEVYDESERELVPATRWAALGIEGVFECGVEVVVDLSLPDSTTVAVG
jgi:hypothetical protein